MKPVNIRVGLLVEDITVPAWAQEMVSQIAAESGIEIALIAKYVFRAQPGVRGRRLRNSWLLSMWMKIERRLVKVPHDAFRNTDLHTLLPNVPTLEIEVRRTEQGDIFDSRDIARIGSYGITLYVQLGPLRPHGAIFSTAPCGIWSFRHGDDSVERGRPIGIWDVLLDRDTTSSILQFQLSGDQSVYILQRSWSRTYPVSIQRNRSFCYWKTLTFAPRKLRELRDIGEQRFLRKYAGDGASLAAYPAQQQSQAMRAPCLMLITRLLARAVVNKIRGVRAIEQWMLLYRVGDAEALPHGPSGFKCLMPPKDRFWADPFVVERNGEYVVFIEELVYARNKGHLAFIRFNRNHEPELPPVKMLERPYHLSYPFTIEDKGELYMIPESSENSAIQLYRCVGFPDRWEHVMDLMTNVLAVDTTIWYHAGKYWLFSCMRENEHSSSSDELFLFWSETLLTDRWRPHPCNPIVSDVRCARPAGKIFYHMGYWYRPAQDCSVFYGRALSFQRIDVIDPTSYRETPVSRLEGDGAGSVERVHTFNRSGCLTVIDGLRTRR